MNEKYGIEKLKQVLYFPIFIIMFVEMVLIKKISFRLLIAQGLKLVKLIWKLRNIKWDDIKNEYTDLDEEERVKLKEYFCSVFDLENDIIEEIIERAIDLML